MPGSLDKPVVLDPWQAITEVGWPSGFVAVVGEESVVNFFTARKLGLSGGGFSWGKTVAEELYDVAFDSAGRVWMGGAPVSAAADQLWQFDVDGTQLLALLPFPDVESTGTHVDQGVRALAVDSDGNLVVGGRYPGNTLTVGLDPNLKKYTPAGALLWGNLINPNASSVEFDNQVIPERIIVDTAGNIRMRARTLGSGEQILFKVSSAGSKLWQITRGAYAGSLTQESFGNASGIALDGLGTGTYVSARLSNNTGPYHIKHVDADGNVSTGPEFNSFTGGTALAATDDGFVYASGWLNSDPGDPAVLNKYAVGSDLADLSLVWTRTLATGSVSSNRFVQMGVTSAGGVVGAAGNGNVIRYDADGNVLWQTSHNATLNSIAVSLAQVSGSA